MEKPINSNILVILIIGPNTASELNKIEKFCISNTPKEILRQFLFISQPVEKVLGSI